MYIHKLRVFLPISLLCLGVPLPALVWYKDAVLVHKLLNPRYKVLLNGSLQIQGLRPEDSGIFQCFAKNEVGEVESHTLLDVTSKSRFTHDLWEGRTVGGTFLVRTYTTCRNVCAFSKQNYLRAVALLFFFFGITSPSLTFPMGRKHSNYTCGHFFLCTCLDRPFKERGKGNCLSQ